MMNRLEIRLRAAMHGKTNSIGLLECSANRRHRGDCRRFPDYVSFSTGLEWRFHIRGAHFEPRGIMKKATNSGNPAVVNRVIDSRSRKLH
jgi:hypothetical protein